MIVLYKFKSRVRKCIALNYMPHAAQSHAPDLSNVPMCKLVVVLLAFGHANIFRMLMAVGSLRLTSA